MQDSSREHEGMLRHFYLPVDQRQCPSSRASDDFPARFPFVSTFRREIFRSIFLINFETHFQRFIADFAESRSGRWLCNIYSFEVCVHEHEYNEGFNVWKFTEALNQFLVPYQLYS